MIAPLAEEEREDVGKKVGKALDEKFNELRENPRNFAFMSFI